MGWLPFDRINPPITFQLTLSGKVQLPNTAQYLRYSASVYEKTRRGAATERLAVTFDFPTASQINTASLAPSIAPPAPSITEHSDSAPQQQSAPQEPPALQPQPIPQTPPAPQAQSQPSITTRRPVDDDEDNPFASTGQQPVNRNGQ